MRITKRKRSAVFLALALSLAVFPSAPSYAELTDDNLPEREGIEFDPLIIHAALNTEVQFDSNVFLSSRDAEFDIITILAPSVGLELPMGDNRFSVDYEFRANIFGVFSNQSFIDHRVRALAEVNWTDYTLTLENIYRHFSDRAGSEDTNRVQRQNNYLAFGVEGEFNQFGFSAGYTFGVEDFLTDDLLFVQGRDRLSYQDKDRFVNTFDAALSYRFLPKTSVLLETYFGVLTYHSNVSSDSWYTETLVGLKGDLRNDFSINLRAGVRYQQYYEADITNSKDFAGPIIRGGATYNFTDNDVVEIDLERANYESTFENMNYYTVNHVGGMYTHYFNNKLAGALFGHYQYNTYPNEAIIEGATAKRYDHLFGGGCSLRYDMRKWVSVEARYEYSQRESRFSTFDFVDNLVTLRGTVGF